MAKDKESYRSFYEEYVERLSRRHPWSSGRCPFPDHEDRNPSFSVNVETGYFKCFGCERQGSFTKFKQELFEAYKEEREND